LRCCQCSSECFGVSYCIFALLSSDLDRCGVHQRFSKTSYREATPSLNVVFVGNGSASPTEDRAIGSVRLCFTWRTDQVWLCRGVYVSGANFVFHGRHFTIVNKRDQPSHADHQRTGCTKKQSAPIIRPNMQVHAVPDAERAFDSTGRKLPWGYDFAEYVTVSSMHKVFTQEEA